MAVLDLGINYGASYSLTFATDVIVNRSGFEQRRSLYSQPLLRVSIGNRRVTKTMLDYLLAFYQAAQGRLNEFEIRDWSDFRCDGGTLGPVIDGRQSVIKTYTLGGVSVSRLLTCVIEDTITEGDGGVSCEFNVPVRFDQDDLPISFDAYTPVGDNLFTLQELTCTEVRKHHPDFPLEPPPDFVDADLGIGKDYGTMGGPTFHTSIVRLPSGWDNRQPNYSSSRWQIGDRVLTYAELSVFIAMFRLCRGRLGTFNFYDWQTESDTTVRFDEDSISFQFEAYGRNQYGPGIDESLFRLNGLAIKGNPPSEGGGGNCETEFVRLQGSLQYIASTDGGVTPTNTFSNNFDVIVRCPVEPTITGNATLAIAYRTGGPDNLILAERSQVGFPGAPAFYNQFFNWTITPVIDDD